MEKRETPSHISKRNLLFLFSVSAFLRLFMFQGLHKTQWYFTNDVELLLKQTVTTFS